MRPADTMELVGDDFEKAKRMAHAVAAFMFGPSTRAGAAGSFRRPPWSRRQPRR
jgi:hypothetical protein